MKKLLLLMITLSACFWVGQATALTPPLSPETLQREADLVVEGEVTGPMECQALVEKTNCADVFRYLAPLKVSKVTKGTAKPGETLKISFVHYNYGKSNCVGDQGPDVKVGQAGTYYLKKTALGNWDLWHWSAVTPKRPGSGELPSCSYTLPTLK